ncbi:polyphosphate kinase 2 family protein [Candidatus Sumerlaeota bacterium]|nr:polyphosphate kinase 2 family protein [Candidatus Sumerlaeota bacterium]
MNDLLRFRVKEDSKVNLDEWDPDDTRPFSDDKEQGRDRLQHLCSLLRDLQEVLYAERKHKVLIVLQGMDTAGKDGVIKSVFKEVNPQGLVIKSFGVPSEEELSRDYLWRIHKNAPEKGKITIFNRSHYEDVLVVRVNGLISHETWKKRYVQIRDFERTLHEEGATILKFFLHIDKKEQKERIQKRLDDPEKNWKFNPGDLKARALWREYMKAYEDAISNTSAPWAPWHIIPANNKWRRDLIVASLIADALDQLNMKYPKLDFDPKGVVID